MSFNQLAALMCQLAFPMGLVLLVALEPGLLKNLVPVGTVCTFPVYIANAVKVTVFSN